MKRALAAAAIVLAASAPQAQQAPSRRDLKLVMIAKSSANFVFISARRGAEDAARAISQKHGVRIEVVWLTPPREDAAEQVKRMAQAVREGAHGILISCSDAQVLTPAIDAATDKGAAVMTFDSDAPASKRFAFYGTDDAVLGEKVMADLAELLGGKGRIAVLAGSPDAPNLKARAEAVRRAAARRGIEVVETVHHVETPLDAVAAVLKTNAAVPDLAGWAMVGGWPLFRSSQTPNFIADLRRRRLKIVAVDGLPEQLSYVENDLVPVLWAQPTYLWGKVGVETLADKLLFGKAVPEKRSMELVKVTRKSLGSWSRQLKAWGFTGIPDEYFALE